MVKRKCIITNQILEISNLIRFDYDKKNNQICLDLDKKLKGRGAYLLLNEQTWQQVLKTKALNRTFRTNVNRETYINIQHQLEEAKCLKKIE
ncbi:YlxR family protein [Mycoplasmopsis phocirhinis]|uniref:YlxR family protein n=1 Tax=Mycoplasmopsis phocirhinis TaxID=142650 RepID=UPI001E2E20EC|nr:YlxR family protein [Mycoplasmopsis phocirhinis]